MADTLAQSGEGTALAGFDVADNDRTGTVIHGSFPEDGGTVVVDEIGAQVLEFNCGQIVSMNGEKDFLSGFEVFVGVFEFRSFFGVSGELHGRIFEACIVGVEADASPLPDAGDEVVFNDHGDGAAFHAEFTDDFVVAENTSGAGALPAEGEDVFKDVGNDVVFGSGVEAVEVEGVVVVIGAHVTERPGAGTVAVADEEVVGGAGGNEEGAAVAVVAAVVGGEKAPAAVFNVNTGVAAEEGTAVLDGHMGDGVLFLGGVGADRNSIVEVLEDDVFKVEIAAPQAQSHTVVVDADAAGDTAHKVNGKLFLFLIVVKSSGDFLNDFRKVDHLQFNL